MDWFSFGLGVSCATLAQALLIIGCCFLSARTLGGLYEAVEEVDRDRIQTRQQFDESA